MFNLKKWLILIIVSSSLFLIILDSSILYTALPTLTKDLGANAVDKLWIVNMYALVIAGLLPGFGTIGDFLGHKKLFIAGLIIFGIASIIAAFSPTPLLLIISRAILAVGAAMMMPATLSIIRLTFTNPREQAFAIAIWASVSSGGAGIGPIIGGVLLKYFWWGSVFLINVPIVLLALIFGVIFIKNTPTKNLKYWDFISSLQIMVALILIVYAIKEFTKGTDSLFMTLIIFLISITFFSIFIKRQLQLKNPLIDLNLFKNYRFSSGVITALFSSLVLVGINFLFTQRFQLVLDFTPLEAGLVVMIIAIASFIAGTIIGIQLYRLNIIKVQFSSLLLVIIGLAVYILIYNQPLLYQVVSLIMIGSGVGVAMTAASNSIMVNAPASKAGMAASIEEVSYELGSALGLATLGGLSTFLYTKFINIPANVSSSVSDSLDKALLIAKELDDKVALVLIENAKYAFDKSYITTLIVALAILISAIITTYYFYLQDHRKTNGN